MQLLFKHLEQLRKIELVAPLALILQPETDHGDNRVGVFGGFRFGAKRIVHAFVRRDLPHERNRRLFFVFHISQHKADARAAPQAHAVAGFDIAAVKHQFGRRALGCAGGPHVKAVDAGIGRFDFALPHDGKLRGHNQRIGPVRVFACPAKAALL